ncbi:MAG: 5-bromo-4-chloroindolyl phosphate hydrolysis family protein [Lachnospiraceae bacterium]|jgi:5-bromo-4-chloroindolyl phosphate hydrolysis protein|nr:5-bromo-4-chloroindolyl phosphate hydrolysis family protein [Lachnospiraceae bacterium]
MAKKFQKSPWSSAGPVYVAAAAFVGGILVFPATASGIFVAGLTSFCGWAISKMFWPKKLVDAIEDTTAKQQQQETQEVKQEEKKPDIDPDIKKRPRTGDKAIDALLDEEEKAISEMRRLDKAIEDEKVSAQIVHLEDVTTKIVNFIVENPQKKSQVRKFFNYYLPTTLKLLNAYDRMDETGISGMNIDGTKGKVEEMMDTSLAAFDKQLDALYADDALDISAEIKVMEGMLAQEGLKDDAISGLKM